MEDTDHPVEHGVSGQPIAGIDSITSEDLEFACDCGDKPNTEVVEAWYRNAHCSDKWFKEENLTTRLLHNLSNYYIYVDMIAVDQWLMISFQIANGRSNGVSNPPDHWAIQADRFEHGLMYAVLRAERKFGKSRKIPFD